MRYAMLNTKRRREEVEAYLPSGYDVIAARVEDGKPVEYIIGGEDEAGWTLDGYVLPRLASGLIFGEEVGPDHPAIQLHVELSR